MLFGHQHNDASEPAPEPAAATAAPDLNPLAVDPSTGVSLPVPTEVESLTTPQSTIVQPTTDDPLNPGPATPPPPPPVPTSAPTVDAAPNEAPQAPVQEAAPEPESTSAPTAEEPTMPFDDTKPESDTKLKQSTDSLTAPDPDEEDSNATLADFMADLPPHSFDDLKPGIKLKEELAAAKPDDLISLKQEALAHLTPLIDKLDQTPEERFRTTMMMLQSTDNELLLRDAYNAAQQIADEKARAQALLDVINEINYFNSLTNQQNS